MKIEHNTITRYKRLKEDEISLINCIEEDIKNIILDIDGDDALDGFIFVLQSHNKDFSFSLYKNKTIYFNYRDNKCIENSAFSENVVNTIKKLYGYIDNETN